MPAIKLTRAKVEALTAKPPAKRTDYFDAGYSGLCLTVGPRSATWFYFRRVDGKLNRLRIGSWPQVGIKDARSAADRLEESIESGQHPKAVQAREREEKAQARTIDHERLVERAAESWRTLHFPTLGTASRNDYGRLLDEFVQRFEGRDISTITRGDIIRHLDTVQGRSGAQANRAAVVLRQLFRFAVDRLDLPANPAADVRNPTRSARRKRTLNRDEIRVLWRACELAGYPQGHVLRFALCTGQRIGEVGLMRWADVHGDYWANAENKTGQRIDIFVAGHARSILKDCPRIGPHVFTTGVASRNTGETTGLRSDTWGGERGSMQRYVLPRVPEAARELGLAEISDAFTPHDLRRTVRTGLTGWAGVSPDTAERVLNHAIGGLRAVYDHADYRPHVADALRRWDAELSKILAGDAATIIDFSAYAENVAGGVQPAKSGA